MRGVCVKARRRQGLLRRLRLGGKKSGQPQPPWQQLKNEFFNNLRCGIRMCRNFSGTQVLENWRC
jgi:hypothetical protein